jgi:GntR family transcriptional repressor for pyruvate dehydrogenase complex
LAALPIRPISSRKVAREVQDQLAELIVSGAHPAGARLPSERDLLEALGVSRTSLREALRGLEALGLIDIRHGSGIYVTDQGPELWQNADRVLSFEPRAETARELLEVRLLLEPEIAALAAIRGTADDLARLRRHVEAFRQQIAGTNRPPSDLQFHIALCQAAHNRPLLPFVQWIVRFYAKCGPKPRLDDVEGHEAIYDAVARRDPDAARILMKAHLESVRSALERHVRARKGTADKLARGRPTPAHKGVGP